VGIEGQSVNTKTDLKKLLKEAQKQASTSSGAKTVAAALAAITKLDTLAAEKLMSLPFSNSKIGLKDRKSFRAFKKSLNLLVPGTSAAIARIPDEPGLSPADIATYIGGVAKRAAEAVVPMRAAPAVLVKSASAESRKRCSDVFGKDFAEKASDRLIQALDIRMYATMRESATPSEQMMVLEMDAPDEELANTRESVSLAPGSRIQRVGILRDSFYATISGMRSDLEKKLVKTANRMRESAQDLGSATDVCWLNGTMRALAPPKTIADFAGDLKVKRIGIPRALVQEINITAITIGAPKFRTANSVTGKDILIAVIDGEVDATQTALKGRVLQKKNYTKETWGHPDKHGTGVAGIIASADSKFKGMAPGAKIASYKVFATNEAAQGSDFDATLAIQQALEDGIAIANCSWGVGPATDGNSREARAFNRAWDLGLIIVKSAGNKGPGTGTMTSPADARGVIVVGATDRKGKAVQDYSSRGPAAAKAGPDFVAPGGAFGGDEINSLIVGGGTGAIGVGTSFAAPHVVGAIALLLEQSPHLTPDQVKTALLGKCVAIAGGAAADTGAGLLII
jgi:serine protease AprX